jgi:hypothetical protein
VELDDDPVIAVLQMTAAAPFGPADRYALLAAPGAVDRLAELEELLQGQAELLGAQVGMGAPDPPPDDGFGRDPGGL